MVEKPREYKRRVDAEWRKNERNKNKLIKKIKEYELLDQWYKESVEREILEAFSKKEKEEKGKDYNDIVKLLEDADKKYEILNQLKRTLEMKEEEKIQNEKEIRENKLDGIDKTIMEKQKQRLDELKEEREKIELNIEEIKKDIADKEEEIRDMEEEYGEKLDTNETSGGELEDKKVAPKKAIMVDQTTLKRYHSQTIRDLWEKDRIRGEIIKILEEGSWIGDELSKKIKKEVSDAFFAYYDEKQGSLSMKAGRWTKNRSSKRDKGEDVEKNQENEETEELIEKPRKIRESLILQWYEKKLNRDELLRVLDENEMMDKESKKKLKEDIMKEFYENYEKAKGEEVYHLADVNYRDMKRTKRQFENKADELARKKGMRRWEIRAIDEEMQGIAQDAMKLEKGGSWWFGKRKLEKARTRRDELDKQERKIKDEIGKLEMEKLELQLSLKGKEGKYGPIIERSVRRPEKVERKMSNEQEKLKLEEQTTLKGYKERYEQMIKDREEYNEKLLGVVRDMDMGISEEMKMEVLENIELNMKKEIEELKEGDKTKKVADEVEKWLKDNWKATMQKLIEMKKEIEEGRKQVETLELKEGGKDISIAELLQIRDEEFELKGNIFLLEDECKQIKADLQAKLERYDGTNISEEEFVVETFEERTWRTLKGILADEYPYKGIDIKQVKKQTTLKGYKQKYEKMIKDKEEYMGNFLGAVKDMDLKISDEKKKEVLQKLEMDMGKEIEDLKKGDEMMKDAEETEKWLQENWKTTMRKLIEMKKEIEEKENQIKEIKSKLEMAGKDYSIIDKAITKAEVGDDIVQTMDEEFESDGELLFKWEKDLLQLKKQRDSIKAELYKKLKKYDGIRISERELVEETFLEMENRKEKEEREKKLMSKTKKMLESYRKTWKREIRISDNYKRKIIKASENIPVKIEENRDGSRMITIRLLGKVYQILVVQGIHSNSDYKYINDNGYLDEEGMVGDNIDGWENGKLKKYVKRKGKEGFHIPTREDMKNLLKELGNCAGFNHVTPEIAMLMYLTGMYGNYFIVMSTPTCRGIIECYYELRNGIYYESARFVQAPLLLYRMSDQTHI